MRTLRHYLPVVLVAAVFVAVVATMPTTVPTASNAVPGGALSKRAAAVAQGRLPAGITPAPTPGTPGITVGGVSCGPGVRQVPWSAYAPICEPAWHGNNGGATWPGVTRTTITITYRYAVSQEEQVLYALVAPSVIGTNAGTIAAMQGYIKLFNRTFELYGRHVVLRPFVGRGDFLEEDQGNDAPQAQADAYRAKALGAFADVSFLASTPLYDQDLAKEGIISIGATFMTQRWFEQEAPYAYSPIAPCDELAKGGAEFVGRSMAGMPAIYAGSPSLRDRIRKFGLVYPDLPDYTECADAFLQALERNYGVRNVTVAPYAPNVAELDKEATNIVAQMRAAGVTTIICACDPVSPILLTQDAHAQGYIPEWFSFNIGDAFARLPDQVEWAHAMAAGSQDIPLADQEAYRAWELAEPGTQPPTPTFGAIYENLLLLFDALQAAGPDLTPWTFERGFFSLPPSEPGGQFGAWLFGHDVFAPTASTGVVWWSPSTISIADGKRGAWLACNDGRQYGIRGNFNLPPDHVQLQCFGQAPTSQ
jgi:hypothetical protein